MMEIYFHGKKAILWDLIISLTNNFLTSIFSRYEKARFGLANPNRIRRIYPFGGSLESFIAADIQRFTISAVGFTNPVKL